MGGLAAIPLILIAIVPLVLALRGLKRRDWGCVVPCLLALAILGWLVWRLMSGHQE